MQATEHSVRNRRAATESQQFPPLELVTRPTVAWPVSELRRVLGVAPTSQKLESHHAI